MDEPRETDDTAADDEGELSPEEAARLIEQTTRQAQRQFELQVAVGDASRGGGMASHLRHALALGARPAPLQGADRLGPAGHVRPHRRRGDREQRVHQAPHGRRQRALPAARGLLGAAMVTAFVAASCSWARCATSA